MSYPTMLKQIGGQGGSCFSFTGEHNGASLEKIWVWVAGWQIKAIRAWLSDGRDETFGVPSGPHQEYVFKPDDLFTALSLWQNGAGTRLGAIKFRTKDSQGNEREFFSKMTEWGLKREFPMDVGSGFCFGIFGRAGADIDAMGFMFLNAAESTVLTNVRYPTLHQLIPNVAVDELKSISYENKTSVKQEQKIKTSKNVTKTSSWSMTKSSSLTLNMEVKAGIPEVVEVSTGYSVTVGTESIYSLEQADKINETLTTTVDVPPKKKVTVGISIGRADFDLPYTGTVKITCKNGSVLQYETKGQYKGVTYTDIKVNTVEKDL